MVTAPPLPDFLRAALQVWAGSEHRWYNDTFHSQGGPQQLRLSPHKVHVQCYVLVLQYNVFKDSTKSYHWLYWPLCPIDSIYTLLCLYPLKREGAC